MKQNGRKPIARFPRVPRDDRRAEKFIIALKIKFCVHSGIYRFSLMTGFPRFDGSSLVRDYRNEAEIIVGHEQSSSPLKTIPASLSPLSRSVAVTRNGTHMLLIIFGDNEEPWTSRRAVDNFACKPIAVSRIFFEFPKSTS